MISLTRVDWPSATQNGDASLDTRQRLRKAAWEELYRSCAVGNYSRWAEGLLACVLDAEAGKEPAISIKKVWVAEFNKLLAQHITRKLTK